MATHHRKWEGERKTRECLRCSRKFQSKGKHNRICPLCQIENEYNGGDYMMGIGIFQAFNGFRPGTS